MISFVQGRPDDIVALLPRDARRRARGVVQLTPVRQSANVLGPDWLTNAAKASRSACETDRLPERNLYERIRARFEPLGGVDLELPPRDPAREPPRFD